MLDDTTVTAKTVNSFKTTLKTERNTKMGLFLDWSPLDPEAITDIRNGHPASILQYKLLNKKFHYDIRKYSFTARVPLFNSWNSLPDQVADVANTFKSHLDINFAFINQLCLTRPSLTSINSPVDFRSYFRNIMVYLCKVCRYISCRNAVIISRS